MRTAIIISLTVHIAIAFMAMRLVRISQVRFVPREVYAVRLVSLEETGKPRGGGMESPGPATPQVAPPPKEPPKKVEEPKPQDLVAPTKKTKTEKKGKATKTVPTTQIDEPSSEPGTGQGGSGPGGPGPVTTGDMALDVADFPFAYYLATVKRKIATNWQVPGTSRESIHCRVYFRIMRSGSIDSPTVETSSGNFLFDQAALRAVIQASPLPPMPGGFSDEYLGVHFSFAYEEE
jgi:TonB family protein